ncbi:Methyl-accepting chemotaxis protein [plant metagenome]|uniref:Methyl-accepting chemotaxis protein n=1 Tax=plant metagenome TaxID=1297885 RepID=A0A484RCQ2_9ZZZZ
MGWIAAGYVGSNPLALAVTVLIGVCYLAGSLELLQYQRHTSALSQALAGLTAPPASLNDWLDALPASLRPATRLRVDGERVGLPGPALTPYLVGLLVLLGMLGTFLGMVATLRGTGAALESAADLQAIRASLATPIKGLGFAFGTSVAGVATSAMLGLLAALARRERAEVSRSLDASVSTTLRPFTAAHRRDEALALSQRQADILPALVEQLRGLTAALQQQHQDLGQRLSTSQDAFHGKTETLYTRLADTLGQALKDSAAESARAAGAAIQPAAEATLAGLTRETATWQASVSQTLQQQVDAIATRLGTTTDTIATRLDTATGAIAQQLAQSTQAIAANLEGSTANIATNLKDTTASIATRLDTSTRAIADNLAASTASISDSLDQNTRAIATSLDTTTRAIAANLETSTGAITRNLETSTAGIRASLDAGTDSTAEKLAAVAEIASVQLEATTQAVTETWRQALADHQQASDTLMHTQRYALERSAGTLEKSVGALLTGMDTRMTEVTTQLSQAWTEALARHESANGKLAEQNQAMLDAAAAQLAQQSADTVRAAEAARQTLQDTLAARDEERLAAWTGELRTIAASLRDTWQQAGEHAAAQQREVSASLSRSADDIAERAREHATTTLAEIARLMQAAAEAPKAAADVIAELRDRLSDSMARDNAMLDERARLMESLRTLHDAVNQACTEQRGAIDALISTSSDLMERVGSQFRDTVLSETDKLSQAVQSETGKLSEAADQVAGSATQVSSLGDAFGASVQAFDSANEKLVAHLARVEAALDKSLARSDEQLAYYVAQAREVVDLSLLSQKQIIAELKRAAESRNPDGAEAA